MRIASELLSNYFRITFELLLNYVWTTSEIEFFLYSFFCHCSLFGPGTIVFWVWITVFLVASNSISSIRPFSQLKDSRGEFNVSAEWVSLVQNPFCTPFSPFSYSLSLFSPFCSDGLAFPAARDQGRGGCPQRHKQGAMGSDVPKLQEHGDEQRPWLGSQQLQKHDQRSWRNDWENLQLGQMFISLPLLWSCCREPFVGWCAISNVVLIYLVVRLSSTINWKSNLSSSSTSSTTKWKCKWKSKL